MTDKPAATKPCSPCGDGDTEQQYHVHGTGSGEATMTQHNWWCDGCSAIVAATDVTFEETHDSRKGGCGQKVRVRRMSVPTPPASTVTPNDTDRLTWLTQTKAYVAWSRDGETCHLVWPYNPHDEEAECGLMQPECYTSPREAIDAAMRGNMPNALALLRATERQK